MKRIILLSIFLQALFVFGQIPKDIKYDQLFYSYDSSTCIITKGKKQTVYNLRTESICIAPIKNYLINFPGSNVYAEIPVKPGKIIIHFPVGEKNITFYCSAEHGIIKVSNPLENSILEANGKYYNVATDEYADSVPPGTTDWGLHEIKKITDGIYLINSFRNELKWMDNQDQVHQKNGINGSGIYSVKEKKWLIEPSYKYISQLNGYFFCALEYQVERIMDGDRIIQAEGKRYTYDIFKLNQDGTPEKMATGLSQLSPDLLSEILGFDAIINSGFPTIYQSRLSDKLGMFMFQLTLSDEKPLPQFQYTELLTPQFEYIHADTTHHIFLTLNKSAKDAISLYWMNKENQPVKISSHPKTVAYFIDDYYYQKTIYTPDTTKAVDDYRDSLVLNIVDYFVRVPDFGSGLKLLDDSLVAVYNSNGVGNMFQLESILNPGEDSVDENFDPVYSYKNSGRAQTGIYNLNTKKWLIEPEYFNVIRNNQSFVSSYPSDAFHFSLNDYYYTAFNNKGEIQFEGKSADEIYADTSLLSKVIPFENCVEIQSGNRGLLAHSQLKAEPESYFIFSLDKMGIFYPDIYFENQFENNYYEFVHYNSDLDATIFLQGDSVYFTCPNFSLTCQKNEKIIYQTSSSYYNEPYAWTIMRITANKDSISLGQIKGMKNKTALSYQLLSDSVIIINDYTVSEGLTCVECMDDYGFYSREQVLQTENSSVWRKTKNGWRKISPNYKTIEPVANRYFIASSGSFYEYLNNSINTNKNTFIEQRYFILDSNLKAIPYLDYFDFADVVDLGFGFKIKLNSDDNYFFMTYGFEALTDAEWDHFEIENGKLKAMIYTQYQIDEYGEQVLDSFGMPVEKVSSTTKYFRFPIK